MRVLVIGGTGFVGSRIVTRLSRMGHKVTVAHRGETEADLPASVMHIHHPALGVFHPEFGVGVADQLRRVEPEIVLHMVPANDVDARAVMSMFRGVARRVVGISSIDVYRAYGRTHLIEPGPPDPVPLSEDAPLREQLYADQRIIPGSPPVDKILVEREILEASGRATHSKRRLEMPETWTGLTGIPVLPVLVHPSLNKHRYLLCHDVADNKSWRQRHAGNPGEFLIHQLERPPEAARRRCGHVHRSGAGFLRRCPR